MFFFFFKQKTAYEMRISDWSSDVCSSDLMVFDRALADAEPRSDLLVGMTFDNLIHHLLLTHGESGEPLSGRLLRGRATGRGPARQCAINADQEVSGPHWLLQEVDRKSVV